MRGQFSRGTWNFPIEPKEAQHRIRIAYIDS
jgi:hypothetical protein